MTSIAPAKSALLDAVQKKVTSVQKSGVLPSDLPSIRVLNVKEVKLNTGMALVVFINATVLKKLRNFRSNVIDALKDTYQKPVYLIGNRKIIPKAAKRSQFAKVKRPYHTTLTAVHDAILEDLIFPSDVFGKRTIHKPDGSVLTKVYVDPEARLDDKIAHFRPVYRQLCNRDIHFEYPLHDCPMRPAKRKKAGANLFKRH